jgi:hypothetical protein
MYMQKKQKGGSAIGLIVTLAIIGLVAYFAIQYIPQHIEASTVDSILNKIELDHKTNPVTNVNALLRSIDNQLNVNEMNDLKDSFKVTELGGRYTIKVSYERELNLIYEKKQMLYEKTLVLK